MDLGNAWHVLSTCHKARVHALDRVRLPSPLSLELSEYQSERPIVGNDPCPLTSV